MRGNWEAVEAMVITPNHGLQQQQPNILEGRHPLHLSTTPGWGIADRAVVKEEPVDDKASDSGVSPDHYSNSASPNSRRSSTANCSLSPDSAASHDSNVVQCVNYNQYSSEDICDAPMDFTKVHLMRNESIHHHHSDQSPHDHQQMDTTSDGTKSGNEEIEGDPDILQCSLTNCPFTTHDRLQFSEHLANHYSANEMPDFSKFEQNNEKTSNSSELSPMDSESNRASPSQSNRSDQGDHEFNDVEEPGVRVPRVNSQGKIKTFRCKQCNFTSITKLEFWDHSRGHIKLEKLLTCPKCPFVTEYKHHLEYHLRNHFGSKPFKCDKCQYSCVNKSMLNSHLKSHSNIYQYRCANCSYATKYLHSLKLHLRKYNHLPAMVLNADGTPNPLPIVDVYGTRRGPKQKNLTPKLSDDITQNNTGNQSPVNNQIVTPSQLSPIISPINVLSSFTGGNGINPIMALQYSQLYNANFSMGNPFGINNETSEQQFEQIRQSFCAEYAKAIINERMNAESSQDGSTFVKMINYNNNGTKPVDLPATIVSINAQIDINSRSMTPELSSKEKNVPLDLSKSSVENNKERVVLINTQDNHQEDFQKQMTTTTTMSVSPKISGTSRRKGKAFKLAVRDAENKNEDDDQDNFPLSLTVNSSPLVQEELKEPIEKNTKIIGIVSNNEFTCQFCEIAFGNEVMYTVHMGYHGYKNPFTCNMCGHQCDDKVSFFLHIARSQHA